MERRCPDAHVIIKYIYLVEIGIRQIINCIFQPVSKHLSDMGWSIRSIQYVFQGIAKEISSRDGN